MPKSCRLLVLGLVALQWGAFCASVRAGELNAALNSISAEEIRGHIEVLADDRLEGRESGSRGSRAAGEYLVEQLQELGLKPMGDRGSYFQSFHGGAYRNILGLLEGSDPEMKTQYIVLTAHYDHVGYGNRKNSRGPVGYVHNGADDNASGVSGLLEVAEAFQVFGQAPKRSILFALWDGEEKGMLGSKHWAGHPTVPIRDVAFAVNLDMIGRLRDDKVRVFGVRTARGLRRLVSQNNQMTDLFLDFVWEVKANSDHYALFIEDVPVLMLHTGLHDDYHRPSDDPDKINHDGASRVARFLFSILADAADRPQRLAFREESRFEGPADRQRFEQPAPPRPPRLGISLRQAEGEQPGVVFSSVTPGSPAEQADLREGDRLIRFAGRDIQHIDQLRLAVLAAVSPVSVVVQRSDNETLETEVALAGNPLQLGISWREETAEPSVVMISEVVTGSAADLAGLVVGDRIHQIDGRDFLDSDELRTIFQGVEGSLNLTIERNGRLRSMVLNVPSME